MTTENRSRPEPPPIVTVNVAVDTVPAGVSDAYKSGSDVTAWDIERTPAYMIEYAEDHTKHSCFDGAEELRRELQASKDDKSKRLVVIHGLPVDYVRVLRDELDLEAEFIESIARRRVFRPWKLQKRGVQVASFDYPELVQSRGHQQVPIDQREKSGANISDDLMAESPVYAISSFGNKATFCRASLWLERDIYDSPLWKSPLSSLQKARYPFSVIKPHGYHDHGPKWDMDSITIGKEIPSLETRLCESWCIGVPSISQLIEYLSGVVLDHWFELFEQLPPNPQNSPDNLPGLYREIQISLERCIDGNRRVRGNKEQIELDQSYWKALLDRADRTMRLGMQLNSPATKSDIQIQEFRPSPPRDNNQESSESNGHQRALDRVTYLGGILLPISIVSGVLSMGDTFGPGGPMFYVFWAVAVPLTIITLLIIYADQIRNTEVWIQVAMEQSSNAETTGSSGHKPTRLGASTPQLEHAIPYRYTETVPVDTRISSVPVVEHAAMEVGSGSEPGIMVQQRFASPTNGQWKRRQLGWVGACKTILQFYKLEKTQVVPPDVRTTDRTRE